MICFIFMVVLLSEQGIRTFKYLIHGINNVYFTAPRIQNTDLNLKCLLIMIFLNRWVYTGSNNTLVIKEESFNFGANICVSADNKISMLLLWLVLV